jgi:prephenate dehydrogenase
MPIRQITIIGTGLIGGSLGLALRSKNFKGRIVGCDNAGVLRQARRMHAIDVGITDSRKAVAGSDLVVLATPVGGIIDLIETLAPWLSPDALLTDVGSTKQEVVVRAEKSFASATALRFLGGHPMAGKENCGIDFADVNLFRRAVWFFTPVPGQKLGSGRIAEYIGWIKKIGARMEVLDAAEHDQLCAWISHVPQMISTALAASLVDEFGEDAPLLDIGGRALRELTRISGSPYSMWRDIAITNRENLSEAMQKLEQRLAHIRENLDTKQLADEFERAHRLRKNPPRRHRDTEKSKR